MIEEKYYPKTYCKDYGAGANAQRMDKIHWASAP